MGKIKKRTFKNQRKEFENDSFIRKETKPRLTKPTGKSKFIFLTQLIILKCSNIFGKIISRSIRILSNLLF